MGSQIFFISVSVRVFKKEAFLRLKKVIRWSFHSKMISNCRSIVFSLSAMPIIFKSLSEIWIGTFLIDLFKGLTLAIGETDIS